MASDPVRASDPIRFGDEYELDLRAYELRRAGRRLKLERIPMDLLVLLVEMRGQLVTRDQIIERIWGKGVFFDSDNSINSAIRKIRQVLKDDSDQPRFVVTITGKGYRFVAQVQESDPPPSLARLAPVSDRETGNASADTLLGKKISHYRILQMLGGGGMGVVYKAEDLKLGRLVAMKFLPSEMGNDPEGIERLEREARAASSLDHPNICSIYEFGEHEGQPFIVMQHLEGQTLREWIGQHQDVAPKQIANIAEQIVDGLEAAHQKGIIHRDIKPANLFLTSRGQVKILDFGVAKIATALDVGENVASSTEDAHATEPSRTGTGASVGTPSYLSPEQVRGEKLDSRTDLFSFGLVLYEMTTGEQAFSGRTPTVVRGAVLNSPARPASELVSGIPDELANIIAKSLEKDRELRYQTASEIRGDLRKIDAATSHKIARTSKVAILVFVCVVGAMLTAYLFNVGGIRQRLSRGSTGEKSSAQIKARPSVAVLGFRNLSGKQEEAWISTALSEMIGSELAAGEQLHVIPSDDVAHMRQDLNLTPANNYSKETLQQIRSHLGSDMIVAGSYLAMGKESGGKIRIDLQLQDARQGETIDVVQSDGVEGSLAELVSRSGAALRQRLGISAAPADEVQQLSEVLPSNAEAARLYSNGLAKLQAFDALPARDLLEKAITIDPKHALSHSALAEAWATLGYSPKAEREAKTALDLSEGLPREQRLSIEGHFHEYSHDLPGAIEIYRTLRNFFPDKLEYGLRLADAQTKAQMGKDALQTIARMHQLPGLAGDDPRIDLAESRASESIGDFAAEQRSAEVAARKATERGNRFLVVRARQSECWSWLRRSDSVQATKACREALQLAEILEDQGMRGVLIRTLAIIEYESGDFEKAHDGCLEALNVFRKIGNQHLTALTLESLGNIDYDRERLPSALSYYQNALQIYREISAPPGDIGSVTGNIANVLDSSGDLLGATRMQEQSLASFREAGDQRGESDVLLNLGNVLAERAELALAKKNFDTGIGLAEKIGYGHGKAYLLYAQADLNLAQDQIQDARKNAELGLALRNENHAQIEIARSQLQLARISLEQGSASGAERGARQAEPTFEQQKSVGEASACWSVLAQSLLAQSKVDEARNSADRAAVFAKQTIDRPSNFLASLANAEVNMRSHKFTEARVALNSVISDSARYGYVGYQYQARLDLAKLNLESGNIAVGKKQLQSLGDDASAKGLLLIARKARSTLNELH